MPFGLAHTISTSRSPGEGPQPENHPKTASHRYLAVRSSLSPNTPRWQHHGVDEDGGEAPQLAFHWDAPAFVSWLGVTQYLTPTVI